MCLMATEAVGGHWIPGDWDYRWLEALHGSRELNLNWNSSYLSSALYF